MTAGIIAGDILIAIALIVAVYLALIMRIRMRSAERKGSYISILKGELLLCGMTVILSLDLRWKIAKRIGHPIPGILWRVVVLCSLAMVLLAAYFTVRVVVCGAEKKAGNCRNAVVLGMALEDGKPTRDLVLRVNAAAEYLSEHPESVLILTGGKTGNTDRTEAGVMKEILIESGVPEEKIELVLPKSEQIPSDRFRKGDTVRAIVLKVELKNNNPVIILSRTSPIFLERLLEAEVPEIYDGLITIRNIVRVPGERAKVAVESYDDRIDPVGSCVGMKGNRIHGIVRELKNENIDVINYSSRPELMIRRSLSPAEITKISINEDTKTAEVFMEPDQVSLAIGKGGHNIKLASKLCGYEIEIYRNTDEDLDDVDLKTLKGDIEGWVVDELIKIGCDTAKSVLALPKEELINRTDLEEETIDHVLDVLKGLFDVDLKEFDDEIDQSVINALLKIGCETAKSVLAIKKEDLMQRTGLDEETIDHVISVLKAEFEEE